MIERSLDAVVLIEPDGRVRYASPSSARLMGYTPGELHGRDGFELVHPDDVGRLRAIFADLVGDPNGARLETYRARHRDGSWRWLEGRGTNLLADPGLRAVAVTYRDVTDQRAAEEAQARLAAIVESAEDAIISFGADGCIATWNPAAERLFGYRAAEIVGRPISLLAPPELLGEQRALLDRAVRGETVPPYRTTRLRADGRTVDVSVSLGSVRDTGGQLLGFSSIYRDVGHELAAERALRESEARFRHTADNAPILMWISDTDKLCTWFNKPWLEFTGRTFEQEAGFGWADGIHPDDRDRCLAAFVENFDARRPFALECRLRRADGRWAWVHGNESPLYDPDGRFTGYIGSCVDITARHEAEAERERLARHLALLLDSTGEGIYGIDTTGRCTFVNRAAAAMLGYEPADLLGRDMHPLVHHSRAHGAAYPANECPIYRTAVTGQGSRVRGEVFWRKDGTAFPAEYSAYPIRDDAGVRGAVVAFTDVTDRQRLEEQYRHSQKMEAVGRLAGGVAHDFNNLLTVINGYAEMLLAGTGPDEPNHAVVGEIHRAGERAAALTRQLLAFSRKQFLKPEVFDLGERVADLASLLRRVIGEDVELVVARGPTPVFVRADVGQTEQVIVNLAVNARDAMPTGGVLVIRTEVVARPRGRGDDRAGGGADGPEPFALLSVADTGTGMTDDVRAHAFEPFFTTKPSGEGTGLGLSMVYGVVAQSGGHIEVDSAVDRGTTFRIYLPAAAGANPPRRSSTPAGEDAPPGTETVLLVEDEDGVRKLVRAALHRLGYTVLEARDGEAALDTARRAGRPIDLLLTDVVMPRIGGPQLAEQLCREYPGLKVLYLSGYTDDAVVRHGIQSAVVHFLQKPFTAPALARMVRRVLDATE
ncbi:hybrid sensor histidine kinase/response regulator [Fimbriiglobus ruber]|uniref:histidine kinase n=1 Tax=Fimbriiglobus ruber TaxID=1908690 RepID=A0A225D839_9BACT|nr:PAS domain-containing sensor histidine kinase [Fimbriiglobus ruber]OWK37622.1 diguanylate cyclase/phosphodiesterase (GGDEF & EAL domains) with PAS/PAC sensor(s) [Fimbriiglobus ruber]